MADGQAPASVEAFHGGDRLAGSHCSGLISGLRKGWLGEREIEAVAIETFRDDGRTSYRAIPGAG